MAETHSSDLVLAVNKQTRETSWVKRNLVDNFPETWELSPKGRSIEAKKEGKVNG